MIGNDTNEIIQELFTSLFNRYQVCLEQSMKDSDYAFDYVEALHGKYHKISLNRGGSYKESPNG